jgi:hypothetical protein
MATAGESSVLVALAPMAGSYTAHAAMQPRQIAVTLVPTPSKDYPLKLRIQDNSIRFRLTRSEVDTLSQEGNASGVVHFPGGSSLEYTVETSSTTGQVRADFSRDRLVVQIPRSMARKWAATEQVSITGAQPLDEGSLSILVEKDFACLASREGEDETDMFPHPSKGQETC